MILISHRGNISGKTPWAENTTPYIDDAIALKYQVEIDVWGEDGVLWLGHDRPMHKITLQWILDRASSLWVHCKNIHALDILRQFSWVRCFSHDKDPYAMVNGGFIWCYPGAPPPSSQGIIVLPETWMRSTHISDYLAHRNVYGICSDFISRYRIV